MGIRLQNSTWRRPLRTIDCWLPASGASPSTWRHLLQQGHQWLNVLRKICHNRRQRTIEAHPAPGHSLRRPGHAAPGEQAPAIKLRVTQRDDLHGRSAGCTRLVISGRMADVCAELDRLAALEAHRLPQGS